MPSRPAQLCALGAAIALLLTSAAHATQIQDLVRVKGNERNTLVGMGLVVGLNGTGDGGDFLPAMRPLAKMIRRYIDDNTTAIELDDAENVALVTVTATLSGAGAREGDVVDVKVSAIGAAESLAGGTLLVTPLTGPLPNSPVYAFARGPISVEDESSPTAGVIRDGAQLAADIMTTAVEDGQLTLVLNNEVATWLVAHNLATLINDVMTPDGPKIARAIDPKNVVIDVPVYERGNLSGFISGILRSPVPPEHIGVGAKVVINERTGTIVFGAEVEISPVLISHKGLTITTVTPEPEPDPNQPRAEQSRFVPIDPQGREPARLADLMNALKQLDVDAEDRIAIVKEIHRSGKLHAKLIFE